MPNDLSKLKINEVSFCKRGMNQHARISLFKAKPEASAVHTSIAKYYTEAAVGGAKDFKIILEDNQKRKKLWAASEELYPLFNALSDSVSSIVADASLDDSVRNARIDASVADFLSSVKSVLPEVEEELQKFFEDLTAGSSGDIKPDGAKMSEEEVKKAIAEAVEKATKESAAELAKAKKDLEDFKAEEDKKKKKEEMQKNDETVVVAGQTIAKSAVGDASFAIFKAQAEQIAKAEERIAKAEEAAELARLEKRAADEFAHLPGTEAEKASLLKFLGSDAEKGKAVEAMLKALDAKNAEAFKTVGVTKSAEGSEAVDAKVNEIAKRDNISVAKAMEKAVTEAPELFK